MGSQGQLEQEMQELRQLVLSQAGIIKVLGEKIMQGTASPSQVQTRASVMTKPRDILVLELQDLEGLEATGRLALFFEGVEQCTLADGGRIKIANSRVGRDIALLLQNRQEKGQCTSWKDVKKFLRTEFAVDINLSVERT